MIFDISQAKSQLSNNCKRLAPEDASKHNKAISNHVLSLVVREIFAKMRNISDESWDQLNTLAELESKKNTEHGDLVVNAFKKNSG